MALTLILLIFLAIFGARTTESEDAGVAVAVAPPTPGATACIVAPRSLEEIALLQATPAPDEEPPGMRPVARSHGFLGVP